jgi:hypothetical protein
MHPPGPGNGRAAHPREAYGSSEKTISNDADKITSETVEGKPRGEVKP